MRFFTIKKFEYIIFPLLAFIYILLLLNIIEMHYHTFVSIENAKIYNEIWQNNWKYWFEEADNYQTVFAILLQYIDVNYLHSKGILPIIVNIGFISLLAALIVTMIYRIFHSNENHIRSVQAILAFSTIILLFSTIQDSSIIWMFNQQLFAAFYFPLLSYYLLVSFAVTKNDKYFYALLFSGMIIILSTPYYFSALIVLLLMGYIFKIGWLKNLLLSTLIFLAFFLNDNDISNSIAVWNLFSGDMIAQIFLYVLNYLGSLFVYVSFEPCIATSSIVGGVFIISTFIYFSYLVLIKKVTEPLYGVILAFLLFYILTAFGSLSDIGNSDIVIFKNQQLTPSLIAWSLILILYIHYFNKTRVIQRRLLILSFTLMGVLYFYQISSYRYYKKDISELRLAGVALNFGIDDKRCWENITRSMYLMMYSPSKESRTQMSIFTVNDIKTEIVQNKVHLLKEKNPFNITNEDTKDLLKEKKLVSISSNQLLEGSLDKATLTDKKKGIIQLHGWIYDAQEKEVPSWLMVLDQNGNMLGYIITGISRLDVGNEYGRDADGSGFMGYIRSSKPPSTLFLVDEFGGKILKVKLLKKDIKGNT